MDGRYDVQNRSERDTHFAGFSKIVWNEIGPMVNDSGLGENAKQLIAERIQRILAQRAYDLMYFLLDKAEYHSGSFDIGWGTPDEIHETISHLPDMTEWPVESSESN